MTNVSPGPRRFLSGVQPSGKLHLGNYFGAIRQHIALQDEATCFYFIADYHALTTVREAAERRAEETKGPVDYPATLRENTRDVALDYLALGLDPDKAVFFRQSDVPEVHELAWILSCVTNMGLLERAVSYKEKVEKGIEANVGLFTYPVLMAADILIYRSHVVPVGKDQVQHLEMTRDMAGYFNNTFGVLSVLMLITGFLRALPSAKISMVLPYDLLIFCPSVPGTFDSFVSRYVGMGKASPNARLNLPAMSAVISMCCTWSCPTGTTCER